MSTINAYLGCNVFKQLELTVDLGAGINPIISIEKLDTLFNRERHKVQNVLGVYAWTDGQITLYDNNTFTGIVWSTKNTITGSWKVV